MILSTLLVIIALFPHLQYSQAFIVRKKLCDRPLSKLSSISQSNPSDTFPEIDVDIKVGGRDMISHIRMLDLSLRKLTGKGVTERIGISENIFGLSTEKDFTKSIYEKICLNERWVLISHGIEEDPIFNFGNVAGLKAFFRTWDDFTSIPSRKSVVFQSIDEELRIKLMHKVTTTGFVEGASGIRVRGDGQFLRLVDAVVWNCYDDDGIYSGQAALFDTEVCPILPSLET